MTLRDVAAAAGVSEMTVSRVLRNRGDVSAQTRERVTNAARALGYVPNRIAGGLASQRVNLIAVVVPSLSNMVFPEVLTGITDELDDTGLQPVIGMTRYAPSREESVLYDMLSWRPSGVILAGLEHGAASQAMLRHAGIPIVEIMDSDGQGIDIVVGVSQHRAGADMARAILRAGYRRIGFLGTHMPEDHRARKRLAGFEATLAEAGIKLAAREFYQGDSSLGKGHELTARILDRVPDLDFMYFSNDMIAAGGLLCCLGKGLDVPARIGLAGFNGIDLLDGLPMRLATTDARPHEIGRRAARIIAGKEPVPADRSLSLTPILRHGDTIRK